MKTKLTMLLLLLTSIVKAQITGSIKSDNGEDLPFVNVLILNQEDSTMISGGLSNVEGRFDLPIKEGKFLLSMKMVGFVDWYSPPFEINDLNRSINFQFITMEEESTLLEGVQVTAKKMLVEQSAEGMTLNVQSSMAAKGSTALQILERSPGVVLDRRYNNLTLNGQSGTLIMINGRPVRMPPAEIINMLSGMSADNLEKVELLTNPSAKYDADGGAGIINLVIKKSDDQGTNGSITATAGYGWGPKEALSLNLNHRTQKVNIYGSYSFNHDDTFGGFHGVGYSTSPILGGRQGFDFTNNSHHNNLNHNSQIGFESEINDHFIVGSNVLYNHGTIISEVYNDADYYYPDGGFLHSDIYIDSNPITQNLSTNVFAERSFGEQAKLKMDVDYIHYNNTSPSDVTSIFSDVSGEPTTPEGELFVSGNRGESTTSINLGVVKMDYSQKVTEKLNLDFGVKGSFTQTENMAFIELLEEDEWIRDERNVNDQLIVEKIGAAYATANYRFDSLTQLNIGLRYEHWDRDFSDDTPDRNFGKFFPSIFVTRNLTAQTSLQMVYNRRITRPGYGDLTTYLQYNDPFSVFTGNPNLKPTISDNFKISYQFGDKNIALIYTHETNPIARYQLTENDTGDLNLISPQNLTFAKSLGLQLHIPIQLTKWWTFTAGGTFSGRSFEVTHTEVPKSHQYITANLYGNQEIVLPQDFSIEISGFYNAPHYNGSARNEGFGMMNLGVKKEFEKNSSLQFTITDVFQTMKVQFLYGGLTQEAWGSYADGEYIPESGRNRIFKLTYFKSFGSTKVRAAKNKNRGSQEERSRVSQ